MAALEHHQMFNRLARLMRTPRERTARVRAVIHSRWHRELRRKRCRVLLIVAMIVATTALLSWVLLRNKP